MIDQFKAAAVCVYFFGTPDPLCYELLKYSEREFTHESRLGALTTGHSAIHREEYPDIPIAELPDIRGLRSTYRLGRRMDYF